MNTQDIIRSIEEPLFILRTYLARAAYTMQDIDEEFFNLADFDPDNRGTWWMLASQYRRNAARAGIVVDALQHIKSAQLSLDRLEVELSSDPVEETPSRSDPTARASSKKKSAQAVPASGDAKGGEQA